MMEVSLEEDGATALDGIDFSLDGMDTKEVDLTLSLTQLGDTDDIPQAGTDPPSSCLPLLDINSGNESVNLVSEQSIPPVKHIDEFSLKDTEPVSTDMEVQGSANLDDIDFDFDIASSQTCQEDFLRDQTEVSSADLPIETDSEPFQEIQTADETAEPMIDLKEALIPSQVEENVVPQNDDKGDFDYEQMNKEEDVEVSPVTADITEEVENNQKDDDFDFELDSKPTTEVSSSKVHIAEEDEDEFAFDLPVAKPSDREERSIPQGVPVITISEDGCDFTPNQTTPPGVNNETGTQFNNAPQSDSKWPPAIPASAQVDEQVSAPSVVMQSSQPTEAEEAWDHVQTVVPTVSLNGDAASEGAAQVVPQPLVSIREFLDHCQRSDWQMHLPNVRTTVERRGFSCLKRFLFGPPNLQPALSNERDMIFCLAASPLNNNESLHIRLLQTIYRKLTGTKLDCARYGSHWEDIGFQGNDPATDLRSVGILSLMQLLHLVSDARYSSLARDIYKLSADEVQNFPFCIMGINMTRIALLSLREGSLNKECNRQSEVQSPFNDFYVAIFLHLYRLWKTGNKTIADTGFVLKDVENQAKKSPKSLLDNLLSHLESNKKKDFVGGDDGAINFMDVCAEE